MSTNRKDNSPAALSAAKADRKLLFDLEPLICDLDLSLDVLAALCRDKLSLTGEVAFSEAEATRIFFMLSNTQRASRDLKAAYYNEEQE